MSGFLKSKWIKYISWGCCSGQFFLALFVFLFVVAVIGHFLGGTTQDNASEKNTDSGDLTNVQDIPAKLKPIFNSAGKAFQVSPAFVAAIFWKERGEKFPTEGPWETFPAGANGPFQFIEPTWEGWSSPYINGVFETDLNIIAKYGGYGQDGDKDNKADVQNLYDSAFAASKYLGANGAAPNTTDIEKLKDAASIYNSGKPWSTGQKIPETANYVPAVIAKYQKLLSQM